METTFKETLQIKNKKNLIMAMLAFTNQFNPVKLMNTKIANLLFHISAPHGHLKQPGLGLP